MTMDEVRILLAALELNCFTRDALVARSSFDADAVDAWLHGNRNVLRVPPVIAEVHDFSTTWMLLDWDKAYRLAGTFTDEQNDVLRREFDWSSLLDGCIAEADKFLAIHTMKPTTPEDLEAAMEAWEWFVDLRKIAAKQFSEVDALQIPISDGQRAEMQRLVDTVPTQHEAVP